MIVTAPINNDVPGLINHPADAHLEFKASVPSPEDVAKQLTGMANSGGGTLVLGVDDGGEGANIVRGVDPTEAASTVERALDLIQPTPAGLTYGSVDVDGKGLYAVEVPKSLDGLYLSGGMPYIRQGSQTTVATVDNPGALVQLGHDPENQIRRLVEAVIDQSGLIKIQTVKIEELRKASSWPRQLLWVVFGAVLGAALGVIATVLLS